MMEGKGEDYCQNKTGQVEPCGISISTTIPPNGAISKMNMDKKFDPGTAALATSTVEISISCRNLLDKDILSKSDPMCVVYHQPRGSNYFVEILRTETIKDNLNPNFATKVTMDYRFEEQQLMRFEVYDVDKPGVQAVTKLTDQDFLGSVECTLAQIVSAGSVGLSLPLHQYLPTSPRAGGDKTAGTIMLLAEELESLKDEVTLRLGGTDLGSKTCCFFSSKVFYELSKANEAGVFALVHRSKAVNGPNPVWPPCTISLRSLCNGDSDRMLKVECFQEKMNGSHLKLGYLLANLRYLTKWGTEIGEYGRLQSSDTEQPNGSRLLVLSISTSPIYTFVDYIQSGTQIHCSFGLDFTSSNGDPGDPTSLHHFSQSANTPNPYEQAIQAVGDIIQDYESTKMFPCYGFGARIPPHGAVSHNFFVTLTDTPYCFGIHGVIDSYRNCIRQIQLYGPTNFSPIIKHVASQAANHLTGEHYFVLVIITDGVITDMAQTKEAIVNASGLPMSIIIVGVGGADFEAMEQLDGDSVRISYNGKQAVRDIVQFVPFRDSKSWMATTVGPGLSGSLHQPQGGIPLNPTQLDATYRIAQAKLAQEVLAEIPDQVTSYMKSRGLVPKNVTRTPYSF